MAICAAGLFIAAGSPPAVASTNIPKQPVVRPDPGIEKLKGRWERPDGGSVLEIKDLAANGKMEAAYFNPRSINVAHAEWARNEGNINILIELRDVNYPGSKYTLQYDLASDSLKGFYFHAVSNQTFDVIFTRLNP